MAVEDAVVDDAAAVVAADAQPKEFSDAFSQFAKKADDAKEGPAEASAPETDDKPDDDAAAAAAAAATAAEAAKADKPEAVAALKVEDIPDLSKIKRESLSPEDRAALDAAQKVLHRDRSDLGRQAAYQRRIDTLTAEIATRDASKAAQPTPKDGEKPVPLRDDPAIKKMIEDLPENSPVVDALQRLQDRVDHAATVINGLTAEQRAQAYRAEDDAFMQAHPDFKTIKEGGDFGAWIRSKPQFIKDIASRHTKIVTDAAEAIELVNLYKLEKGIPLKPAAAAKTDAAPVNNGGKRQAQLDAARATPAKTGPDAANADAGYTGDFARFAAKKQKRA